MQADPDWPLVSFLSNHMSTQPFTIPDLREPGQPMASLPIKLPLSTLEALKAQAERMRCNRTALERTLLICGLKQLDQGATDASCISAP